MLTDRRFDTGDRTFGTRLLDLGRLDWRNAIDEPGGIEFNLPISSWIRLFHDIGFDVIDYIEVRAPESATGIHGTVTAEWAKRFPSEQVWRVRKRQG